jgi:hypothetical protein
VRQLIERMLVFSFVVFDERFAHLIWTCPTKLQFVDRNPTPKLAD